MMSTAQYVNATEITFPTRAVPFYEQNSSSNIAVHHSLEQYYNNIHQQSNKLTILISPVPFTSSEQVQ